MKAYWPTARSYIHHVDAASMSTSHRFMEAASNQLPRASMVVSVNVLCTYRRPRPFDAILLPAEGYIKLVYTHIHFEYLSHDKVGWPSVGVYNWN